MDVETRSKIIHLLRETRERIYKNKPHCLKKYNKRYKYQRCYQLTVRKDVKCWALMNTPSVLDREVRTIKYLIHYLCGSNELETVDNLYTNLLFGAEYELRDFQEIIINIKPTHLDVDVSYSLEQDTLNFRLSFVALNLISTAICAA